jgi:hypothetical protein
MNFPSLFLLLPLADEVARQWDPVIVLVAKLAVVMALVLLNGFFVVAEFALVKIRDSQLNTLAAGGMLIFPPVRLGLLPRVSALVGWGNLSSRGCSNHFLPWRGSNRWR